MIQSEIESVDMEVEKYKNIDFKVKQPAQEFYHLDGFKIKKVKKLRKNASKNSLKCEVLEP